MMKYDYAVIGLGMIGAAAFKYLSLTGKTIIGIGPGEPEGPWHSHNGVFGSHYDQGRITRQLDRSQLWADLAIKSISEYGTIEQQSGIQFYHQVGCIHVGPTPTQDETYITEIEQVAHSLSSDYTRCSALELRDVIPQLHFDEALTVLYEPKIAGYVNPRQLVEAQVKIARNGGAHVVRETAVSLKPQQTHFEIKTDKGSEIKAAKVLISAGGWTQFLLGQDLGLIPKPRTILLARLSTEEAERLKGLPSMIFSGETVNPAIEGFYALPPILYPDGHVYLKIGTGLKDLDIPERSDDLNAWFQGEGSKIEAEGLKDELFRAVKNLKAESLHVKPCVTTYTPSREPLLEEIESNLFVATGGCGAAAKSSNEIGRVAAEMVIERS